MFTMVIVMIMGLSKLLQLNKEPAKNFMQALFRDLIFVKVPVFFTLRMNFFLPLPKRQN